MDTGPILSSTPRKIIGKPMLRLSIPTPNTQFASTKIKNNETNSSTSNASQSSNNSSTLSSSDVKINSIVDNYSHAETNATNKNNQSEVEKLIRCERSAQPNKCRSDGMTAIPLTSDIEKISSQIDSNLIDDDNGDDSDDDGNDNDNNSTVRLPSYTKFESDFRRRIDEMNATNRFDMRLKGNNNLDHRFFFFFFTHSFIHSPFHLNLNPCQFVTYL